MMQRMHQILDSFSRKVSKAKRARTLNQSVKPVQVNGNGTNGYLIKCFGYNKVQPRNPFKFTMWAAHNALPKFYLRVISHKAPGPLLNK